MSRMQLQSADVRGSRGLFLSLDARNVFLKKEGAASFFKMAATIDNSNAAQANRKKHLGIPEAAFVVRLSLLSSARDGAHYRNLAG